MFKLFSTVRLSTTSLRLRTISSLPNFPRSASHRIILPTRSRSLASMAPFQDRSAIDAFTSFGNFDLVQRVQLDYTDVVVSKWRSRVSGLTLVHLDYEGVSPSLSISYTSEPFSSSAH